MDLTSRQWDLYNLLKSNPYHWWTQEEICEHIKTYTYSDDDRNHCVDIGTDKDALNESDVVDKIIVTKKHMFKIATYEEYVEERNYHIRKLKKQVAMIESMDNKFNRNGQGKLFNNILNELKPQNEQFHETFMNDEALLTIRDNRFAYVDLINKIAYITQCPTTLNLETGHLQIEAENEILSFDNIAECITMEKLSRPFYEDYKKVEIA